MKKDETMNDASKNHQEVKKQTGGVLQQVFPTAIFSLLVESLVIW